MSDRVAERSVGGHAEVLRVESLSKSFSGNLALKSVNFDVRAGEVHALLGENGAGKSTLIQILAGVHKPTSGRIMFDGQQVDIQSVQHSRALGISAVFQEFSIAKSLTVEDNLYLGAEPKKGFWIDRRRQRAEARALLQNLGFALDVKAIAGELSRAEQQMVEIAKAFRTPPSILILDEPTASLTDAESQRLFELVRELKQRNVGIIYITHRMHEIEKLADRVTVLRDGAHIATLDKADAPNERLITLMIGREQSTLFPTIDSRPGKTLLEIRDLSAADFSFGGANLIARAGEVVGIAGLVGSGKSQLGRACFGALPVRSGTVQVDGKHVTNKTSRQILNQGLCYIPSDRAAEGLFAQHPIRQNISISSLLMPRLSSKGLLKRGRERPFVKDVIDQLEVRPTNMEAAAGRLSGGNQQKVMIGRYIARGAQVYIFDEPTVGVDVGARHAIYQQIKGLCAKGCAVVLISSDLPEVLNLSSRIYVMHRGDIIGEGVAADLDEERLLSLMFGH
ncbi:sugar ABC transporter ATP-binding protein [Corticibacterium sp. UT-5YL-CI-8]|nr:sugar ABC transporter ATP-binding protein [Tianweitania sp. UT-5YL-CI-8]